MQLYLWILIVITDHKAKAVAVYSSLFCGLLSLSDYRSSPFFLWAILELLLAGGIGYSGLLRIASKGWVHQKKYLHNVNYSTDKSLTSLKPVTVLTQEWLVWVWCIGMLLSYTGLF
jgi:Trk-type K+ transport system membrane component